MLACQRPYRKTNWLQWGIITTLLFSLAACASTGVYGKFVYTQEVDDLFESLTVLPDHAYFFSGSDARPRVILAIDDAYTLSSKLWKPVDMTAEQLKRWVLNPSRRSQYDAATYGRYIYDDKGQRIGAWYALEDWNQYVTVKMLDDTTVEISQAKVETNY